MNFSVSEMGFYRKFMFMYEKMSNIHLNKKLTKKINNKTSAINLSRFEMFMLSQLVGQSFKKGLVCDPTNCYAGFVQGGKNSLCMI